MKLHPTIVVVLLAIVLSACSNQGNDSSSFAGADAKAYRWEVSVQVAGDAIASPTSAAPGVGGFLPGQNASIDGFHSKPSDGSGNGCIRPGAALLVTVRVFDKKGRLLRDPRYSVTSDAPDALEDSGPGLHTVRGEGALQVTVTYLGRTASGVVIPPASFQFMRDSTPPQVAVHQPLRGAMLTSSGDIRTTGLVTDALSTIQSVLVNDAELLGGTAGSEYAFDVTPPGRWGVNVIEIFATDSCGNTAHHVQSYLRSEDYLPVAAVAEPAARVPRGHSLRMTQQAIDDGDRGDLDDVATWIERYLENNLNDILRDTTSGQDFGEPWEVPNIRDFILGACTQVSVAGTILNPGIQVLGPKVDSIRLQSAGASQSLSADRITAPVRLEVQVDLRGLLGSCIPALLLEADVTLSARMNSHSTSTTSVSEAGRVDVTLDANEFQVTLTDIQVSATGNAQLDGVISGALDLFAGRIGDLLGGQLRGELESKLEDALNKPLETKAELDGGPFDLTLNAVAGIDGVQVNEQASNESGYVQVYPSSAGTPYLQAQPVGAIHRMTAEPDLSQSPGPVTYAIDDNLVNAGMWALWYGGALELPDLIGLPGASLQVSALLPPVLMPGSQPGTAALGLGGLKVMLSLDLGPGSLPGLPSGIVPQRVQVEAYAAILVEGGVEYDGHAGQLKLEYEPGGTRVYLQVIGVTDGIDAITDSALLQRIRSYAGHLIAGSLEQLADGAMVSAMLPPLRLAFDETVAGGTIDIIEIDINQVARSADHVVIDMSLRAQEPPDDQLSGYLELNNEWTAEDLAAMNIPRLLRPLLTYREEPVRNGDANERITVRDYRLTTRPDCESAGTDAEGKPICMTRWKFPLDYGRYCGAGRPVVGWLGENPTLDPVDYCCRLHDQNLFDDDLDASSPANACGFVMCLSQATAFPAEITRRMPDVEDARQQMYRKAKILCDLASVANMESPGLPARLPPPEIVAPAD